MNDMLLAAVSITLSVVGGVVGFYCTWWTLSAISRKRARSRRT